MLQNLNLNIFTGFKCIKSTETTGTAGEAAALHLRAVSAFSFFYLDNDASVMQLFHILAATFIL